MAIKPDFGHILCPSRAISDAGGIFPCLLLRKCLKTGKFAFGVNICCGGGVVLDDFGWLGMGDIYIYYRQNPPKTDVILWYIARYAKNGCIPW